MIAPERLALMRIKDELTAALEALWEHQCNVLIATVTASLGWC